MKKADPTIQVGAVLAAHGNGLDDSTIKGGATSYPDGKDPVNQSPQPWNPTV
ncbi:hypothetical protein GCM10025858_17450 [Alicyclobacillus sacchari]|nr:hypothetical protein GCM10025858_17450 [Alicyclobacillus sacchari]